MAKGCALTTGYLPRGGLPRNSVDRITDGPDMTSAVERGRKAVTQTNNCKLRGFNSAIPLAENVDKCYYIYKVLFDLMLYVPVSYGHVGRSSQTLTQ